jgi:hypothetical protein
MATAAGDWRQPRELARERAEVGRALSRAGFQQIKIYSSVTPENVKAICADAHKVGMTVTGHIPNGMNAYEGGSTVAKVAMARKLAVRLYWRLRKRPSLAPPARMQGSPEKFLVDANRSS